ncbi:MAG: hypothetical protein HY741_20010 [Chloroflexi bacterium]|nr:hypothetical protein [Chloroflexota bacterium]
MGKRAERTPRTHRGLNPWRAWQARAQDKSYWRKHTERGLLEAEYVREFVLRLWFEQELDVAIYELDFAPMIVGYNPGGIFSALKNKARFRLVRGDYALIWLNPQTNAYDEGAIDLAPECVRFFCERYGKTIKTPSRSGNRNPTHLRAELSIRARG